MRGDNVYDKQMNRIFGINVNNVMRRSSAKSHALIALAAQRMTKRVAVSAHGLAGHIDSGCAVQ